MSYGDEGCEDGEGGASRVVGNGGLGCRCCCDGMGFMDWIASTGTSVGKGSGIK